MRHTRTDTVTLDGRSHDYTVKVRVPSDRDAQLLRAVYAACSLVVAGALVWSTVSIGALLSFAAPAWASYMVAGAFDLGWVVAMALEYLSRHDRLRAAAPRNAGWLALAVSMSLITLHGVVQGGRASLAAGIAGSLVALVSKTMWHLAMKHSAVRLDAPTAAWLRGERNALGAQTALTDIHRQLNRSRAAIEAERAALGLDTGQADRPLSAVPDAAPVRPAWLYNEDGPAPRTDEGVVLDPEWLRGCGWVQDADGSWTDPDKVSPAHPSVRRPSVRPIGSGIQSVVNQFLADHPDTDTDTADGRAAVRDAVRSVLPDASTDNIGKAIRRARGVA